MLIVLANLELCTMGLDDQKGRSDWRNCNMIVCVCSADGVKPKVSYASKIMGDHISTCLILGSTVDFHPFSCIGSIQVKTSRDSIDEFQIWMVFGINKCSDSFLIRGFRNLYSFSASLLKLQDAMKYDGKGLRLLLNWLP